MLEHKGDHYGGVIINSQSLPNSGEIFELELSESLESWKSAKKRGIWLKIPISQSALIPIAVEKGFKFHHCKEEYVMLTNWLAETHSSIPLYATHNVGVGGFVVRETNGIQEALVVKEKNGQIKNIWKFPGGMSEPGENIPDCAIREVKEETGIDCTFDRVVCFREIHNANFSISNFYFVCLLKAVNPLQEIKIQTSEIEDAMWMNLMDILALPYYVGVHLEMMRLSVEVALGNYAGIQVDSLPLIYREGNSSLFHANL